MKTRRLIRAFTLLEVLVAFMILAISLTVLLRIFGGGVRSISTTKAYTIAAQLAESRLAVLTSQNQLIEGTVNGTWDNDFYWQQKVEQYKPMNNLSRTHSTVTAYKVTIGVGWGIPHTAPRVKLSSIRLITNPRERPADG
jgi:general secretion pathway protein I